MCSSDLSLLTHHALVGIATADLPRALAKYVAVAELIVDFDLLPEHCHLAQIAEQAFVTAQKDSEIALTLHTNQTAIIRCK